MKTHEEIADEVWKKLLLLCASTPLKDHNKVKQLTMVTEAKLKEAIRGILEESKEEK